ncbi:hypothetical protein GW17_00035459 [Ensete ventricosum]|uniref:Uncharacterized protein n=1 Tax=Ensete ventricosum TaxID=4639 RepID=A0A427B358_ENSVE|nr:hypothetical protein B296_00017979 [Ensete ventricosum]RWW01505.1 hypothetical protein GW17_00035459 [Ensete ventricosum]
MRVPQHLPNRRGYPSRDRYGNSRCSSCCSRTRKEVLWSRGGSPQGVFGARVGGDARFVVRKSRGHGRHVSGIAIEYSRWSAEACSPDLSLGLGNTEKIHCFCCDFGGNRKKIEFYAGGVVVLGF